MSTPEPKIVLIAGATGYVGGRLLRVLEEKGVPVRCLARRPEVLQTRVGPQTEVIKGDLAFPETLPAAFDGVSCAYYLVHSLGNRDDFESEEERTAQHFATAARNAGVRRILYL
ncbi:MAG TPA: NAD(P)H-binding protein, partial [Candidatus Hydrogenedentes bacterium]|nr:NAD(P)H-binding protein [Candidatus Hydrogenedentota bacterium]